MRKLPVLVAAMGCFVLTSPAAAQQRDSAAGIVAANPAQPTLPTLVASTDSAAAHTAKLGELKELRAEKVRLVDISEMVKEGSDEAAKLDAALTRNADAIGQMRAALDANTVTGPLLTEAVKTPNVVALHVDGEGVVWVYHRK